MTELNDLLIRRARKVFVQGEGNEKNFDLVASFDANLRKLGYALDNELAFALIKEPRARIVKTAKETIAAVKEIKGVRRYSPMYPNFPAQVMEASEAELYINAIMHYFGDAVGLRIMPHYEAAARPELDFDASRVVLLGAAGRDETVVVRDALLGQKSAWSQTDRDDALYLIKVLPDFDAKNVNNRENLALVNYWMLALGDWSVGTGVYVTTATDVLRLAVAMSDGDVSLSEKTRFALKRAQRRTIMSLLDGIKFAAEDMNRHRNAWLRLGEHMHAGEFKHFTTAVSHFNTLRNETTESFNAKVEKTIAARDLKATVELLKARPGEFARRLDKVLRMAGSNAMDCVYVLKSFSEVGDKASPTVLTQAYTAFGNRDKVKNRVFFPKGRIAKAVIVDDERALMAPNVIEAARGALAVALVSSLKDKPALGKVYFDESLRGVAVPFGLRNASEQANVMARGSRLPFAKDTKVLRFFIWWKDIKSSDSPWGGRVDIDLSGSALDKNFNTVFDLTYYNLREGGAVHSGDITSAPNGASEFIDFDLDVMRSRGVRYVMMTLHSYSRQPFTDLPECFAGFMERKDAGSGEIYEPLTVTNKVTVSSKSTVDTPFIFDLETGEAIWVDLPTSGGWINNVANTKDRLVNTLDKMVNVSPPLLVDLVTANVLARGGELVQRREDADYVIAVDGDLSPFDTAQILSDWL